MRHSRNHKRSKARGRRRRTSRMKAVLREVETPFGAVFEEIKLKKPMKNVLKTLRVKTGGKKSRKSRSKSTCRMRL